MSSSKVASKKPIAQTMEDPAIKDSPKSRRRQYTPNSKERYMCEKQKQYFIQILYDMLSQINLMTNRTIDSLRETDVATPDENDRASRESDFALELREREREGHLVGKVRRALQRIESQDFGYCEECGDKIGLPRLLARPVATLCFECKNLQEYKEKING